MDDAFPLSPHVTVGRYDHLPSPAFGWEALLGLNGCGCNFHFFTGFLRRLVIFSGTYHWFNGNIFKKNAGFTQLILQWLGFMVIWDYSWWFGNGLYHPKAISISSIFTATVGTPSIRLWICKSIYLYLCMIKRLNWVCIPNWQLSLTLQPTQTHTQIFIRVCIYIYNAYWFNAETYHRDHFSISLGPGPAAFEVSNAVQIRQGAHTCWWWRWRE